MTGGQSRRAFLTGAARLAATSSITATAATVNPSGLHAAGRRGISEGLNYRTTRELVAALRNRQVSAVELLEHTITRIEAVDNRINAVVVRDFERARAAAILADAGIAKGGQQPLLGVPMTIKNPSILPGCRRRGACQCSRAGKQAKTPRRSPD